jgi:hypothetical protein
LSGKHEAEKLEIGGRAHERGRRLDDGAAVEAQGGGGNGASQVLKARLVGSILSPSATGNIRVTNGTTLTLTGDITRTGLPANTWLDLVISGTVVPSSPTFLANSGVFPDWHAVFS